MMHDIIPGHIAVSLVMKLNPLLSIDPITVSVILFAKIEISTCNLYETKILQHILKLTTTMLLILEQKSFLKYPLAVICETYISL